MGRWPEGSRQRLQDAALELFADSGYAATTVDAIVERAGLSQRTFFRHFRDKEEVLFDADDRLLAVLVAAVRTVPPGERPRALVTTALRALARELGTQRDHLRVRAAVLASDIALQGRDLAKQARWTSTLAAEMAARGVPASSAALLAGAGAGAFTATYAAWLVEGGDLEERLVDAVAELADALR